MSPAFASRAAPLPPAERRTAILEAVGPLVAARGEQVTSRELAAAAGVSEGTIFKAFGCKDDLLCAVVAAAVDLDSLERALDEAIADAAEWPEALLAAIEVLQARTSSVFGLLSALDERFHPTRPGPLPVTEALTSLMASAPWSWQGSPAEAARTLRSITFSVSHPLLIETPRTAAEVADLFLHGYAVPADPEAP